MPNEVSKPRSRSCRSSQSDCFSKKKITRPEPIVRRLLAGPVPELEMKNSQPTHARDFEEFMGSELITLASSQADLRAQLSQMYDSFECQRSEFVEELQSNTVHKSVDEIEDVLELSSMIKDLQSSIHTASMTMEESLDAARRHDVSVRDIFSKSCDNAAFRIFKM